MDNNTNIKLTRRQFLKAASISSVGLIGAPYLNCGKLKVDQPIKREFGKLNFEVTTLGLGGQASIQWTPADVDPVNIILKAFDLGVNYFDTSNLYGPSQLNYGKAFRILNLIPGQTGYNEKLRRSIWLTSKSHLRWAKGDERKPGLNNWTNGTQGSHTIDDLKRSLSQIYGDGQGNYPKGAYLDMLLIHSVSTFEDVNAIYEGLENPDPNVETIGALAALRDYRDGTNLTGLNPDEQKLVKHIGFSGHFSPPVMMELIQRDTQNVIDGMLVAINSNDRLNFNMQHNVIPVASAKDLGIIAMKVFADGAMYTKDATWSRVPEHVVRTVGSDALPSRPLVEYSLTTPGIHTAIIGIGQISDDEKKCQLAQNLSAAQIYPNGLTKSDRRDVELLTSLVKEGKTNYFQTKVEPISAPQMPAINQQKKESNRVVELTWHTAFAGDEPLKAYRIIRDNKEITEIPHRPQTTKQPFKFEDMLNDTTSHKYQIVTVDAAGKTAASDELIAQAI